MKTLFLILTELILVVKLHQLYQSFMHLGIARNIHFEKEVITDNEETEESLGFLDRVMRNDLFLISLIILIEQSFYFVSIFMINDIKNIIFCGTLVVFSWISNLQVYNYLKLNRSLLKFKWYILVNKVINIIEFVYALIICVILIM